MQTNANKRKQTQEHIFFNYKDNMDDVEFPLYVHRYYEMFPQDMHQVQDPRDMKIKVYYNSHEREFYLSYTRLSNETLQNSIEARLYSTTSVSYTHLRAHET